MITIFEQTAIPDLKPILVGHEHSNWVDGYYKYECWVNNKCFGPDNKRQIVLKRINPIDSSKNVMTCFESGPEPSRKVYAAFQEIYTMQKSLPDCVPENSEHLSDLVGNIIQMHLTHD